MWFHLGGTTLSDFCNAAGTQIDPWIWKGKQQSQFVPEDAWPATQPPSPKAVERWQEMLNLLFSDPASPTHALRTPLGPWLEQLDSEWIWWHDPTSNRVLEHQILHEWHQWIPPPVRYQQQHYRHLGLKLDPPLLALQHILVTVSHVWLVIPSDPVLPP